MSGLAPGDARHRRADSAVGGQAPGDCGRVVNIQESYAGVALGPQFAFGGGGGRADENPRNELPRFGLRQAADCHDYIGKNSRSANVQLQFRIGERPLFRHDSNELGAQLHEILEDQDLSPRPDDSSLREDQL